MRFLSETVLSVVILIFFPCILLCSLEKNTWTTWKYMTSMCWLRFITSTNYVKPKLDYGFPFFCSWCDVITLMSFLLVDRESDLSSRPAVSLSSKLFILFTWSLKILFPTPDIKFSAPILSKSRKTLWKRRSSSWTSLILMLSNTVLVTQRYIHKDISIFEKPCAPLYFSTVINWWTFWRRNPSWIIHKSSFRTAQWTRPASVRKPARCLVQGRDTESILNYP